MSEWIDTDTAIPEEDGYYLVACRGGNVTMTYCIADRVRARKYFSEMNSGGCYSRKVQGKASAHFEISHRYGYQIDFWAYVPKHPDA